MSVFKSKLKKTLKKATAWSLAALTAMTCASSLPSVLMTANAASDILSNEERGIIYANSRSDFRDETIYFLITTRFYDGDPSNNEHCVDDTKANNPDSDPAWRGDFAGLIDKLDYIKALGFTAIWITPVVQNRSSYDYHGYHAYDFTAVDTRYESNGITYQDLIDACHAKGMKVIQDVVFNHSCNWGEKNLCPIEIDVWAPNGRSEMMMGSERGLSMDPNKIYHHFGYCGGGDYDNYNVQITCLHSDCFDLNTENPAVYNYLIDCYKTFVDMGVDAFRVDTVKHLSRLTLNKTFIPALRDEYKKVHSGSGYDDFYMFGEVCTKGESTWYRDQAPISTCFYTWADDDTWLNKWTTDPDANIALTKEHYDAHNDLGAQPTSTNAFLNGNDYHTPDNSIRSGLDSIDFQMHWQFDSVGQAFSMAKAEDPYFSDSTWSVTYVNSHDYSPNNIQTIIPEFSDETWAEDLNLIFTFRGIPCIYYGTEIRFQHGKPIDVGPNAPLSETGRAYFGDNIEGGLSTTSFGVFDATDGTVKTTLESPLSQHLIRLNRIRQAVPALRKGQYSVEGCSGEIAFKRRYTDATTDSFCCVTISSGATFSGIPNGTYVDAVTGDTQNVTGGTLTANCSGQGDLRVYVLSTSKTPAPGRVVPNGSFMGDGGSATIINHESVNTVKPTGISVDKPSVTVLEGETASVVATVTPSDASASVSWSSSNPAVATVANGKIKGVSVGNATITAKAGDFTAQVAVTVKENTSIVKPTGISITPSSLNLTVGDQGGLTATVTPSNATDKTVTWSSSNPSVATVSAGSVTAVAAGNATITATTSNGLIATASITVEGKSVTYIENGVYFEKPSGWGNTINAYIYDKSTDTSVVGSWPGVQMTDDGNGVYYYPYSATSSTLLVIFNDGSNQVPGSQQQGFDYKNRGYYTSSGYQYTVEKTTTVEVTSVSLNATTASVDVGSTTTLNATVLPSNATDKTITWKSSDTSVATVSGGVVKGVSAGTAVITATSANGKTATCTVTVVSPSQELKNNSSISAESITLGNSVTLTGAASGGTAPYTYAFYYKKSTDSSYSTLQGFSSTKTVNFKPTAAGDYDILIKVKDNAGASVRKQCSLSVISNSALKNNSKISASTITFGSSVTLTGAASGGTAPYTYAFYYKKSTASSYTTISNFSSTKTYTLKPTEVGKYDVVIKVKDSTGEVVRQQYAFNVINNELKNNSKVSTSSIALGDSVTLTGAASGGTSPYTYAFYYKKSTDNSYTTIRNFSSTKTATFKPTAAGNFDIVIKVKDSAGSVVRNQYMISVISVLSNTSKVSATSITLGNSVKVTGAASGGTAPYYYAVYYKKTTDSSYTTAQSFSTNKTVNVKPAKATTYVILVRVKDSEGTHVDKTFNVKVAPAPLTNNSKLSATSIALGSSVTLTGAASGGTSPYTYAFYYKKSTDSSYTTLQNFSSTKTATLKPTAAGSYDVVIKVKDSAGTVERNQYSLTVTKALANNSKMSATSIELGSSVTLTGAASGGTSPYTYAFYYKKSTDSSYTTLQNFSTTKTATLKPTAAGSYDVVIKVKDNAGAVERKQFSLTVTKALTNSSKLSATSITLGSSVTLTGAASGGTSPYTYAFYYKKSTDSSYTTLQNFSSTKTATFKPTAAGTYDIVIKVKDSTGAVVRNQYSLKVTAAADLTNSSKISATSVKLGNSVTVTCAASGGTSPYHYAVYYKKESASSYTTAQDYSTNRTVTITPGSATTYQIVVRVKDAANTVKNKTFTVTVTK